MKNRLQWLYNEYMSEINSDQKETCEHQDYMKNLAMEMFAIENLMKSDIKEHIHIKPEHAKYSDYKKDNLTQALHDKNWKWVMYELLKDEVHGAKKYLALHDLSLQENKPKWVSHFKDIARQETEHAAIINNMYSELPYTHGTTAERSMWDKEYMNLIEQHKENVSKLL